MALIKPGFYLLAKHGPWQHHVRVSNGAKMGQVIDWLDQSGKIENTDYEILLTSIQTKNTKMIFAPNAHLGQGRQRQVQVPIASTMEPIFFFNDSGLATYVKLTWGGQ